MESDIPNRAIPAGNPQNSQNRPNLKLVDGKGSKQLDKGSDVANLNATETGKIRKTQEESIQRLEESVSQLNNFVQSVQRDLRFSIDEFSGETVIKVLDTNTEEVIRQIPSAEVLALTKNIDSLKGVLFSAEV